jgi:hypothetical protein
MSERSEDQVSVGSETLQIPSEMRYSSAEAAANDKMYEPKKVRKIIRVLTVMAYVLSVSLAAIMLSLYYVFLWDPKIPTVAGGVPMALTDPGHHQNIACSHPGKSFKTPAFPDLFPQ